MNAVFVFAIPYYFEMHINPSLTPKITQITTIVNPSITVFKTPTFIKPFTLESWNNQEQNQDMEGSINRRCKVKATESLSFR